MATARQSVLHMSPSDLIKSEPLDYGGFGEVYLCYHVTLGQVVMKRIYTGHLRNEESKRSLLEEGNIMASLNHERVVKLLGVIMEDRDCSLVMELVPRGNLSAMLEKVPVPMSIKGRVMVEILEGMIYLTDSKIVHKDIKPENILVDKEFHIKIADLGLAICQTWTKLTKEESRRKSNKSKSTGARAAGTLSYMAPEHLQSIHTASTEKSDVYSFAIVVWVILTGKEPYANARNEDHISLCVRSGDRPADDLIPVDTPAEIIRLMKMCWDQDPHQRPTFSGAYDILFPFYERTLEPSVEKDVAYLKSSYEGPGNLVEKMRSLSVVPDGLYTDFPASLVSSERSVPVPVEASIEDLHAIQYEPPMESAEPHIQADAKVVSCHLPLEEKLGRELQYHIYGSYTSEDQPDCVKVRHRNYSNPFLPNHFSPPDPVAKPSDDRPAYPSSVQSWTKPQEEYDHSAADLYGSMGTSTPDVSHLPLSNSSPSLGLYNQQHPHSHFDRQQSWPTYPVSDTYPAEVGRLVSPSQKGCVQDSASLFIQNAHGIQIGNNNRLSITPIESARSSPSLMASSPIKQALQKYDDHPVTEVHLDLLRANIGANWKQCARRLDLTDVEIETIDHDCYRDGLPEMVHQMLQRWKMKGGSMGCTVGRLCRALQGCIKVDLIQKLLDSCGSST